MKMQKMILSNTVLAILLLITSGTLAVVTSGVMMQTVDAPHGDVGPKGDTGPAGAQGLRGDAGLRGATGATGPVGPIGATGATGATGEAGAIGADGAQGPKGETGQTGATGATGPAGANGLDGATWLSGLGVPASNLGVDGDYYLNTANDDVYNKVSGTWTTVTNIKGATGETGPIGPAGIGVVIKYNDTYAQSSVPLSTDYKTVSSITLTAPSDGYVVLNVNAMAVIDGDITVEALGLGTKVDAYPNLCHTYAGTTNSVGATTYYPITLQAVVPVTEGSNYNFFANAYLITALQPTDLYYIYMTAIFSPT